MIITCLLIKTKHEKDIPYGMVRYKEVFYIIAIHLVSSSAFRSRRMQKYIFFFLIARNAFSLFR